MKRIDRMIDSVAQWAYRVAGADGLLHALVSATIATLLALVMPPIWAALTTLALGVAKEAYDHFARWRPFSLKDLDCNALGVLIVLINHF